MDHSPEPTPPFNEPLPASAQEPVSYPPKYQKQDPKVNVWVKSATSLALYLVLGYYVFPSYMMLLIITAIVILHEMGHFLAMKFYGYNELGIFFIPLLGAYVSGTKREVSQMQSAVILLAGPLPGIILGTVFYLVDQQGEGYYPFDISLTRIALLMIVLNLINLVPVYPLDGGQLLNRLFLDEDSWVGKLFVYLSIAAMVYIAWKLQFWILLIFPVMMLLQLRGDSQLDPIEKQIEEEGINADTSYEELSDKDYWEMRNILIREHDSFRDVDPAPPYEFSKKEDKIMTMIRSLLHRHLIQDISIIGKIAIVLIWVAAFALPWLLKMDMSLFQRFFY